MTQSVASAACGTEPDADPAISLLICTRNRCDALDGCLDHVARAIRSSNEEIECIVVDNGSTDGTADTLRAWSSGQPFSVTIPYEPRPGLARARNTGLSHCRGQIIAMTDDDCELAADYFTALQRAFERDDGPAIRGGRVELGDPRDLPITIKTSPEKAVYDRKRKPGGFIMGANLAFNRRVFDILGPFDERFGAGSIFRSAEDTDYIIRADNLGIPVYYDPSIVVHHFHGRRDRDDLFKLYDGYNFGDGALYAKHLFTNSTAARLLYRVFRNALRDMLGLSKRHPLIRNPNLSAMKQNIRGMLHYLITQL